jgi:hypothetical protein
MGEAIANSPLSRIVACHQNSKFKICILNSMFAHLKELDYKLLEIRDH